MKRVICLFLTFSIFLSCSNAQERKQEKQEKSGTIKVFYFHGKQRCPSCIAIEKLTKEELYTDFKKELCNGKVVLKIVDITENEALADKYKVAWSSLILDKDGKRVDLTDMGFSYAKGRPAVFKTKLKEELNKLLK